MAIVSLFGVNGLTVPQYDIEFQGLTESGVVDSINPFNSSSYPHCLDFQTWRMEIGDEAEPKAQKPEILTETASERRCDLADGDGEPEILRAFPTLTAEQVRAAIAFAAVVTDMPYAGLPNI